MALRLDHRGEAGLIEAAVGLSRLEIRDSALISRARLGVVSRGQIRVICNKRYRIYRRGAKYGILCCTGKVSCDLTYMSLTALFSRCTTQISRPGSFSSPSTGAGSS